MSKYTTNNNYHSLDDNYGIASTSLSATGGFLNHSMLSTSSQQNQNTSANSSKAVLAALKALQEKIRRLEAERSQALDDCADLRHQLKALEIETEHAKQKDNLTVQKTIQESRVAYDRLLNEKTELELKLSKLEDKNRSDHLLSDELQHKIRLLEEEKHQQLMKMKDLESLNLQLESKIAETQKFEKDSAQSLLRESKRHENEVTTLTSRVKQLQSELETAYEEKGNGSNKVKELDKLVGQLLAVNESLVEQLSGKIKRRHSDAVSGSASAAKKLSSSNVKPQQPVPVPKKVHTVPANFVPRVASVGTISSDANKTKKVSIERLVPVRAEELENLRRMHHMYADLAQTLLNKQPVATSSSTSTSGTSSTTRHKSPMGVSASKNHPPKEFSVSDIEIKKKSSRGKTPTRLSRKKSSSSNNNNHNNDNQSFTTETRPNVSSQDIFGVDLRESRQPVPVRVPSRSGLEESMMSYSSVRSNSSPPAVSSQNSFLGGNKSLKDKSHNMSSILPEKEHQGTELTSVISSLEDEFESLNQQYRRLLSSVQGNDANEAERAEELISVIQKLHKKGEQLRALKSPAKADRKTM